VRFRSLVPRMRMPVWGQWSSEGAYPHDKQVACQSSHRRGRCAPAPVAPTR
jgi:hypothetical protein